MWGACLIAFIAALMGVGGPAVVGKVEHGVSIMYLVVALSSFTMYFLHKKANIHPFRIAPLFVGLGGFGYLVMLVSAYVPALSYVACILIGFGMTVCMLAPLYGVPIMKAYPSRYVASAIIGLAITAVLIHAVIAEMFLGAPIALYIFYAVIMAVLVFVFTQVEPFLMFALRRRISDDTVPVAEEDAKKAPILETEVKPEPVSVTAEIDASDDPLLKLSPKKREVAQLICLGYTNKDIATTLYLSEHTVKGYVKDIYITLDVHSRMELAVLVNNYRLSNKK